MRRAVVGLFVLAATACAPVQLPALPAHDNAGIGRMETVARVVDGDTIRVGPNGDTTVRVLGIDSPETVDPRKPVQCWGPESSAWVAEQLPVGSNVWLVFDSTQDHVDRYGRLLAYVLYRREGSSDFVNLSVESARAGMARSYVYQDNPVSQIDMIQSVETESRQSRIGLWSCPENAD